MNEKYEIDHKLSGTSERASIELTLKPAEGYFVKLNGLLDFEKMSANSRITQNLMSTGQRINELENGPSSYRLKKQFFGSNRVGFDVVRDLV